MTKGELFAALAHVPDTMPVDIGVDLGFGQVQVLEIASARVANRFKERVPARTGRLYTEMITQPIVPATP